MRHCLEKLKDMVPVGSESSRHTTLGLLTKAKGFIKVRRNAFLIIKKNYIVEGEVGLLQRVIQLSLV